VPHHRGTADSLEPTWADAEEQLYSHAENHATRVHHHRLVSFSGSQRTAFLDGMICLSKIGLYTGGDEGPNNRQVFSRVPEDQGRSVHG